MNFSLLANTKDKPDSFADLAERLMPSVVNISTTHNCSLRSLYHFQVLNFLPGSPFEDMFKEFGTPQKRKSAH